MVAGFLGGLFLQVQKKTMLNNKSVYVLIFHNNNAFATNNARLAQSQKLNYIDYTCHAPKPFIINIALNLLVRPGDVIRHMRCVAAHI